MRLAYFFKDDTKIHPVAWSPSAYFIEVGCIMSSEVSRKNIWTSAHVNIYDQRVNLWLIVLSRFFFRGKLEISDSVLF